MSEIWALRIAVTLFVLWIGSCLLIGYLRARLHPRPKTTRSISDLTIINDLYRTASEVVRDPRYVNRLALEGALKAIEAADAESQSLEYVTEFAREKYVAVSSNDIDLSGSFTHFNDYDGYWVGAWLWVGCPEVGEEEPQDGDDADEEG